MTHELQIEREKKIGRKKLEKNNKKTIVKKIYGECVVFFLDVQPEQKRKTTHAKL